MRNGFLFAMWRLFPVDMNKLEILAEVLENVSNVTEVPVVDILSRSRREEDVTARILMTYCLIKKGLLPAQVSELIGQTTHNVYRSLRAAEDRYRWSVGFRFDCDQICKQLGINCDLTSKH